MMRNGSDAKTPKHNCLFWPPRPRRRLGLLLLLLVCKQESATRRIQRAFTCLELVVVIDDLMFAECIPYVVDVVFLLPERLGGRC